jgi:hypothetical protein
MVTASVPETLRLLRATADELARIQGSLARALTTHLFASQAPEVITFTILYAATQARYDAVPPERERLVEAGRLVRDAFPPARQVEDLLLGDPVAVEAPFGVAALIGTVVDAIRDGADEFERRVARHGEPPPELCQYMLAQCRMFLILFVEPAQLVGEQLLVLDLARMSGMEEIPFPGALRTKGIA